MTMIELQDCLSQALTDVLDTQTQPEEHSKALANAEAVARIAKQMINNSDVILRADKLSGRNDRIDRIVG